MAIVSTWVLDEGGKVRGYDEDGSLVRSGYPGCGQSSTGSRPSVGAAKALELWAAEARGRLRSVGIRPAGGGLEGLDYGYVAALHVEKFFEERGRWRRWAPLMIYGGESPRRSGPETWQMAVLRLGGGIHGTTVAPWDFWALAELVTGEVEEALGDWLLEHPFDVG